MKKIVLILIGIVFMVSMVNAEIQTHIVPDDYEIIQDAIDASTNGDYVKIRAGDYYQSFDFPQDIYITVQGYWGSTFQTKIHGDGNDNIIVDMFGAANYNTLKNLTIAGDNNTIGVRIGNLCYSDVKDNIICNNDIGCLLTDTDYSGYNNIISNQICNNNIGIKAFNDWQYSLRANIGYNCIYNNQEGIEISNNSFPNDLSIYYCTIVDNEIAIVCGQYQHFLEINSTIIWNNMDAFTNNQNNLYITYSDIQGGWTGTGNIDTDPYFANPQTNDYSLQWNADNFSPCIDAGDPETEWDADNTPPDIGAIPAQAHDYFYDQYDHSEYNRIDWISYPVLNTITEDYTEALGLLERQWLNNDNGTQTDDILECVWFEDIQKIWFYSSWQNDLGNFDSKQGYKVELQDGYDDVPFIGISGQTMDVSEPIQLYANQDNWIGCYLEEPASIEDALSSIWNNLESVASEHWRFIISQEPNPLWTVNPGELYIITVSRNCELVWDGSGGGVEPYRKEMTDYFDYEEELDYMAINVDTVYGDTTVTEIAVYDGEECLGASKVEDGYPVQILAYTPEGGSRGSGLQFQLYSGNRNATKSVTNYTVYENEISGYVNKPVYYDRDGYVNVQLNTEQVPEPEIEFTLLDNYPNPINTGLTHISFAPVQGAENTEIKIYNLRGQLVKKLDCEHASFNNGLSTLTWDCTDTQGSTVSSGIYFYKLESGQKIATKKMVIIR